MRPIVNRATLSGGPGSGMLSKQATDLVLVPIGSPTANLLTGKSGWVPLYHDSYCVLFVRDGHPSISKLTNHPVPTLPDNGSGLVFRLRAARTRPPPGRADSHSIVRRLFLRNARSKGTRIESVQYIDPFADDAVFGVQANALRVGVESLSESALKFERLAGKLPGASRVPLRQRGARAVLRLSDRHRSALVHGEAPRSYR